MEGASRTALLAQYRRILRLAQRFPSVKRDTLIEDIRVEWRAQRTASTPAAVSRAVEVAVRGEETLRKYVVAVGGGTAHWTLNLEEDPLGAGAQRAPLPSSAPPPPTAAPAAAPARPAGFTPWGSASVHSLK